MSELFIAITAGLGGMIGWGLADFFSAQAIKKQKLSELQANLLLWIGTSAFMWLLVLISRQPFEALTFEILVQLIIFALLNMVAYLLFFRALHIGNLSTISTIFSTYAVGAVVISILFFGELVTPFRLFCLLVIFLGISFVSIQDTSKLAVIKGLPQILAASVLFAIFFPLWDAFLSSHQSVLFWVALVDSFVAVLFFAYIKVYKKDKLVLPKRKSSIIFAAAANTAAVALTTWGFAATSLTSVIVVIASGVPLVSAVLGYKFLKERLIPIQYFGIITILIGVVLLFGS